jgi:hypothetical protein
VTKQSIPSISSGLVELESDAVFELDSPKGNNWLESVTSFRFIPTDSNKPYTARKESGKGGDYWYGYRKEAGKLHKRYIGKTADLTTAKLEEIAQNLNTPPVPRHSGKVTDAVTGKVTDTRISTLEEQIKALQESVRALQDVLPGKLRA